MSGTNAYVAAWLNWTERAGKRWSEASAKISAGTYEPKHLMSDALATWVTDPMQWWQDVASETGGSAVSVLIDVIGAKNSNDSIEFSVPDPAQARITNLKELGGDHEILEKPKGTPGAHVYIEPKQATTIVVSIAGLDANIPSGQYVGFVYAGSKLLAHVIALR